MKVVLKVLVLFSLSVCFFSFSQTSLGTVAQLSDVLEEKAKEQKNDEPKVLKRTPKKVFQKSIKRSSIDPARCTKELLVQKTIGPATLDNIEHAVKLAQKDQCSSLLLLINTPGGSVLSTRKIVEVILNSPLPILCLVHPAGAHAGSAGAIILQACHVNGALETTNLGAATPILGGGKEMPEDLRKKVLNDTTSWMDSLTELRKRNKKFGRDIIVDAKAVSASEAYKIGAIDFLGKTKEDFLEFSHGIEVQMQDSQISPVAVGSVQEIKQGIRYHFVNFITDPEFVYLLFLAGIALIYFEVTHAGFILPGILGIISLIFAFMGMHKLSFVWGGFFLILLGITLMVLEVFVTSFGVLALSGVISFIFGSFFLFDPSQTGGLVIPLSTILISALIFSSIFIGVAFLALSTLRKGRQKEEEKWIGMTGEVVEIKKKFKGLFEIQGEIWRFKSNQELKKGDTVKIIGYSRMVFTVEKFEKGEKV